MKTVPITERRQRVAEVIDDLSDAEPLVILQRSRPAAYLMSPERYDRDQRELHLLRRQLFLAEVREAEEEYRAGDAARFDDVDSLLHELRG
jgi:prevent-host-death family protein